MKSDTEKVLQRLQNVAPKSSGVTVTHTYTLSDRGCELRHRDKAEKGMDTTVCSICFEIISHTYKDRNE